MNRIAVVMATLLVWVGGYMGGCALLLPGFTSLGLALVGAIVAIAGIVVIKSEVGA